MMDWIRRLTIRAVRKSHLTLDPLLTTFCSQVNYGRIVQVYEKGSADCNLAPGILSDGKQPDSVPADYIL